MNTSPSFDSPYASLVTVYILAGGAAGQPLLSLGTYCGFAADVMIHGTDGQVVDVRQVNTPAEILEQARKLRRISQDAPEVFVTINVTRGHATLVA